MMLGYITMNELHKALKKKFKHSAGPNIDKEVEKLFEELDTNGSGVIEYVPFSLSISALLVPFCLYPTLHANLVL